MIAGKKFKEIMPREVEARAQHALYLQHRSFFLFGPVAPHIG